MVERMPLIIYRMPVTSRWRINQVHRSLIMASAVVGVLTALPGHSQEPLTPLVVVDGKPVCGEWPEVLLKTGETVLITLSDRYGQKIKVLADGQSWRLVLMAGAQDSKFGCAFAEGVGVIAR